MGKQEAKDKLDQITSSKFTSAFKSRAKELVDDPSPLDQDVFGICGMASIVYAMLKHDPERFAALVSAVFDQTDFQGLFRRYEVTGPGLLDISFVGTVPIDSLKGREKQYMRMLATLTLKKKSVPETELPDPDAHLDFLVTRALGKYLKVINRDVYDRQKIFSAKLKVEVKLGELALDTGAINILLNLVVGAYHVLEVPILTWSPGGVQAHVTKINKQFSDGNCQFGIVAINGADALGDAIGDRYNTNGGVVDRVKTDKAVPAKKLGDPVFEHWVVLNGPITTHLGYYVLPTWTWTFEFDWLVPKSKFADYISIVVCGSYTL